MHGSVQVVRILCRLIPIRTEAIEPSERDAPFVVALVFLWFAQDFAQDSSGLLALLVAWSFVSNVPKCLTGGVGFCLLLRRQGICIDCRDKSFSDNADSPMVLIVMF